jgi:hypothetical protein
MMTISRSAGPALKHALIPVFALFCHSLAAHPQPARSEIETAAKAFAATLDASKKKQAMFPFSSEERENWHYTPVARQGLPLKQMSAAQKTAAMSLLRATLSEDGLLKAKQVIELEGVLAEMEDDPLRRDTGKYYFSLFGEPGAAKGWGYRFEGHHLSLNLTFVDGHKAALTPSFYGTNPAEVRQGPKQGLRPLADEEDRARELTHQLLAAGLKEVVFSTQAPAEILTGEQRKVKQLEPVGIPAAKMPEAQRSLLFELIGLYTGKYRKELAADDMRKIRKAGPEQIRFGWAGSLARGEAYYYRIQGPSFLMEAANAQNNANHMHSVWRDAENDFGRDLLGEHLHDHE